MLSVWKAEVIWTLSYIHSPTVVVEGRESYDNRRYIYLFSFKSTIYYMVLNYSPWQMTLLKYMTTY